MVGMVEQPTVREERRARFRFGARAVLAFVAVGLVAVPFSILVVLVTAKSDPVLHLDRDTADTLHSFALAHPAFTSAMKVIGLVGSPTAWWIVLTPVFAWLLYRRLPRLAVFLAVTALGSSLLNSLVKATVDRTRPHLPDPVATAHGTSFPSGHAQAATVGCGVLVLIFLPVVKRSLRPWLYVVAAVVVAVIGFSRIALGVHFFSDVIGAVIVGTAWLLAMTAAFSAWRREEHKPPVEPGEGLEPEQRQRLRGPQILRLRKGSRAAFPPNETN
jgi:membrane-associated phospholipid phosphatase